MDGARVTFDRLNASVFGGQLPYIKIEFTQRMVKTRGKLALSADGEATIKISSALCKTPESIRVAVGRAMCQAAQLYIDKQWFFDEGVGFRRWHAKLDDMNVCD